MTAKRFARGAAVVSVLTLVVAVIAVTRVKVNGSYADEIRALFFAVVFVMSLIVWGIAFLFAATSDDDDQHGFEVVLKQADGEEQRPASTDSRSKPE
jgi:hypothetical protein